MHAFANLKDVDGNLHRVNVAHIVKVVGDGSTGCTVHVSDGTRIRVADDPGVAVAAIHGLQGAFEKALQIERMKGTIEFQREIATGKTPVVMGPDGRPLSFGPPKGET